MNSLESGEDYGTALVIGVGSGAIEALTEKYSLDNLLSMKGLSLDDGTKLIGTAAKNTLKQSSIKTLIGKAIKDTFKQAGIEASEEMASNILNVAYDALIKTDRSDIAEYAKLLQTGGLSESAALKEALTQFLVFNTIESGIGGFISGGLMFRRSYSHSNAPIRN